MIRLVVFFFLCVCVCVCVCVCACVCVCKSINQHVSKVGEFTELYTYNTGHRTEPRSSDSKTDVLCANKDGQFVIFISPFVTERK